MGTKITKRELTLIVCLLVITGLFIGLALAHNKNIDALQTCQEKLQANYTLHCLPNYVNAPGQDIKFNISGV